MINTQERAWDLFRQLQAQHAVLKNYADTLKFVRVRQPENREAQITEIATKLWEIAERMRGDMNPDWGKKT